jgi:hypothetical protein
MLPFHFRAARALEFRRKQEDEARMVLARAEGLELEAATRVTVAGEALLAEGLRLDAVQRAGATAWLISWHRSWIANQRLAVDTCRRERELAAQTVVLAGLAVREAYRRRRTLERLRDRMLRKYQLEVQRQDTRDMNELAGLRHTARAAETEGAVSEYRQHQTGGRPDPHGR